MASEIRHVTFEGIASPTGMSAAAQGSGEPGLAPLACASRVPIERRECVQIIDGECPRPYEGSCQLIQLIEVVPRHASVAADAPLLPRIQSNGGLASNVETARDAFGRALGATWRWGRNLGSWRTVRLR